MGSIHEKITEVKITCYGLFKQYRVNGSEQENWKRNDTEVFPLFRFLQKRKNAYFLINFFAKRSETDRVSLRSTKSRNKKRSETGAP
jgi:hypothetical protein